MHGMLNSVVRGQTQKRLDIDGIAQIKSAAQVKIYTRQSPPESISSTSTLNWVAWRRGLEEGLAKSPTKSLLTRIFPFAGKQVK
jgi:fructose-bisphosphate aldolase, class II